MGGVIDRVAIGAKIVINNAAIKTSTNSNELFWNTS